MSHAAGSDRRKHSMETTTPTDTNPRQTAALDSGDLFGLRTSADRLHQAIAVMLKDWRDGDFALPRLAEIHMAAIEDKYREVGKALCAADDGPHFVIVGYNGNSTPCAAMTVYAASAGIDVVRANAVIMMHDAGHEYVKTADVMAWPNADDELRPTPPNHNR